MRVRYAETDQMGVVYHSSYFPYFGSARAEAIRELGFTYADMEKMGIMPVMLSVKVILKELPLHHKIAFHHEVANEKAELLASGRAVLYFMESKSMEKSTVRTALPEKLQPYFT